MKILIKIHNTLVSNKSICQYLAWLVYQKMKFHIPEFFQKFLSNRSKKIKKKLAKYRLMVLQVDLLTSSFFDVRTLLLFERPFDCDAIKKVCQWVHYFINTNKISVTFKIIKFFHYNIFPKPYLITYLYTWGCWGWSSHTWSLTCAPEVDGNGQAIPEHLPVHLRLMGMVKPYLITYLCTSGCWEWEYC